MAVAKNPERPDGFEASLLGGAREVAGMDRVVGGEEGESVFHAPRLPQAAAGRRLLEVLSELRMTKAELARRIGRQKKTVSEILRGRTPITAHTALQLEQVLGEPAQRWLELEAAHQRQRAAKRQRQRAATSLAWLDELPVDAMVAAKWIPEAAGDAERVVELLGWFGVTCTTAWQRVYVRPQAAYHRAPDFEADPGTLAAWMRTGELQARRMRTAPYDRKRFQAALGEIRRLTLLPPEVWQDRMVEIAAGAGVCGPHLSQGLPCPDRPAGALGWGQIACRPLRIDRCCYAGANCR